MEAKPAFPAVYEQRAGEEYRLKATVVQPLLTHEVSEIFTEVHPVAHNTLLFNQQTARIGVHHGLRGKPCPIRGERSLHPAVVCPAKRTGRSDHGLHGLLDECGDTVGIQGIDVAVEREGRNRPVHHERSIRRWREECVKDRLHGGKGRIALCRGIAKREDGGIASWRILPSLHGSLLLGGRLNLCEVGELVGNVGKTLLVAIVLAEKRIKIHAMSLEELDRSEYVRRLYAPVAIGIEKLKRPSVEAKAIVRGGKHRP